MSNFSAIGLETSLQSITGIQGRSSYLRSLGGIENFPQESQLPSMRQSDIDPLTRFYQESGPWNPQQIVGDINHQYMSPRYPGSYDIGRVRNLPSHYHESSRSDVGSSIAGRYPHDSGYGSKSQATKSVMSAEPIEQSQSFQSLPGEILETPSYPEGGFPGVMDFAPGAPYPLSISHDNPEEPSSMSYVCPYPECKKLVLKNHSENR